jgi:putative adhesin
MTEENLNETPADETGTEPVRTETFPADGPLQIDVAVTIGKVEIHLTDHPGEARVELRQDSSEKPPWVDGMASMLNWVTERFGNQFGAEVDTSSGDAVGEARVEKVGNRLVVQASKTLPLRNIPLSVTVHAPAGSHLEIRAGAADVTVTGSAGRADILTGSGVVALDRADGAATIRTGSGGIKLGPTLSGLQLRTGSGDVEASSLSGSATLATGTGDIWLGAVAGDVMVRSGSGDLSVADAASGSLELITGSGEIRIGIRSGVAAEIDLTSLAGKLSSELEIADSAPEGEVPLKIRARTGSGNALVTPAAQ